MKQALLYCGTGVFLLRGDSFLSVFWLWFETSYSHSADFLQQRNGALSAGILYFLAGPVMCHPDVVNIAKNDIEINHILSKTWKYILYRLHRAVFFILNPKKRNTDTDNARVAMPCKSAMNMAQKKARPSD
ncbi:hypothetical protein [Escherichia coli]|uniref:hypothetical protein n=1 Tax=Escherichia coli TaxID=562 RepID=UPI001D0A7ACD|nr:hypothetical protein [Escherichia coli]MCB8775590.1 hypothetical protein [Escherichia coli]